MASQTSDSDIDALCDRLAALAEITGLKDKKKFQSSANKKFLTQYMGKYKGLSVNDVDASVMGKLYLDEKAKMGGTAVKYFTISPGSADKYIGLCAFEYAKKKKLSVKSASDPEVEKIKQEMIQAVVGAEKAGQKQSCDEPEFVKRLTDTSKYTGAHKERFDQKTGKGLGKEGRETINKNSGYVTGYKGEKSYGDKK